MKRFLCLCLTAALLLSISAVGYAAPTPTLTVSEVTAAPGDTVSVTVSLANNPGIIGFRYFVTYDAAVLELTKATPQGIRDVVTGPLTKNPFVFTWMDALKPDNTYNGAVITLTFRVREEATAGKSPITVTYQEDDVINAAFENVDFAIVNGGVTVKGATPATPAEKVEHSVTERDDDARGLAFRFAVPVCKVRMGDGNVARTDAAYALYEGQECPLVRMGALVATDPAVGIYGDRMVRGAVGVTDVATTTLLEVNDTTCSYALRIQNIPDRATDRLVYARSYYVIRYQGEEVTVYGAIDATTYRACRPQ